MPASMDDLADATVHEYRRIGDRALRLYWFGVTTRRAPVVVFFHGGSWQKGTPAQFAYQCRELALRGVAAATVEYRLLGTGAASVWDCISDAQAALRWVRAQAESLGIDPHRLAAAGGSAGGHLALATAMVDAVDDSSDSCVPNLMLLYNPVTDTAPPKRWAVAFAERGREASPLHRIGPGLPECLIMHGSADTTTPLAEAKTFAVAMQAAGNSCTLAPYADAGHGFFNAPPHQWATTALVIDTLARQGWCAPS